MPYKFNPFTGNFDYYEAGSGLADLATVLTNGNTSGANDINFDVNQGLLFSNSSRVKEGRRDQGLGGAKGVAMICSLDYQLKWEAGRLYVMDQSGLFIRWSLYNFTTAPTVNDDDTKGYYAGSRWSLDDGTVYLCSDATTGAAVWTLQSNAIPTLEQVLNSGNTANNLDIIDIDKLDFNTGTSDTAGVGEMAWNDTDGTLDLGLKGGLLNKIGQQVVVRARNNSGSSITKGSVVKVVGVAGGFIGINLALGDSDANSATAFGIVSEDIADASNGFVGINGIIHGLNTNAFTEGDILYLSPTVAGTFTNVKPVAPKHAVVVGYVAKKSATDGHILMHVQNGYELEELHDVSITSEANNDALIYESSTQLWKNKTIATALGFTPVTNARTITTTSPLSGGGNLTADRTISIPVATTLVDGYLSSTDWTTFNNKQTALGFTPATTEGWSVIIKSANQDVTNNATLVDDTDLQFSVVAGGQYMIELDAVISANNTSADYQSAFNVSSGTMKGNGIYTATGLTGIATVTITSANAAASTTAVSTGPPTADLDSLLSIKIIFSFTASANATFKYKFAQNVAIAATTARTLKGSILKYKKIN